MLNMLKLITSTAARLQTRHLYSRKRNNGPCFVLYRSTSTIYLRSHQQNASKVLKLKSLET